MHMAISLLEKPAHILTADFIYDGKEILGFWMPEFPALKISGQDPLEGLPAETVFQRP